MLKALKYTARVQVKGRLISLAVLIVISLLFYMVLYAAQGIITHLPQLVMAPIITAIVFIVALIVNILADAESMRSVFTAPAGYLPMMAPVPGWKTLLWRALPIFLFDGLCVFAGIACILAQMWFLPFGVSYWMGWNAAAMAWFAVLRLADLPQVILIVFLSCALAKSVFFRRRQRVLLGIASFVLLYYLLSLLNLILLPLAQVNQYWILFDIHIIMNTNTGSIAYLVLSLAKSAALFCAAAYLIERKVNL